MGTLVVVRHAKAERPESGPDRARRLSPGGLRDAHSAGLWLRETQPRPDVVLSSPAPRALETATALVDALDPPRPAVNTDERLYDSGVAAALALVRAVPDAAGVVALVGHNPTLSELVSELTGQPTDLRTCGIAVLAGPSSWAGLGAGTCALTVVHTARG